VESRLHKTLSQEEFRELCEEIGDISSPEHFLESLHQAGTVFYRPELFGNRIVLDQNWALQAVYTVFHRQDCYRQLLALGGRFTKDLLNSLAWQEYSHAEQALFLSMMLSSGMAFVYREEDESSKTSFVVPDLLPQRSECEREIQRSWDDGAKTIKASLRYPLLHDGLMRQVIATIGQDAGTNAIYWRGGTCFYDSRHRSNGMIEVRMPDAGWEGEIHIACQRGNSELLLDALIQLVSGTGERMGLFAKPSRRPASDTADDVTAFETSPKIAAAPFPRGDRERWYVSYAWGDDTAEGIERTQRVETLCDAAEKRKIDLLRDASALQSGDSIHSFMASLSRGDRVIIILSDKYLKSPYCMFELYSAWRFHRTDPDIFADVVRAFKLPDARIGDDFERAAIAGYWRSQVEKYENLDMRDFSEQAIVRYKLMRDYANRVGDILDLISDRVSPSNWDDFLEYAFSP
jgi:internalin A